MSDEHINHIYNGIIEVNRVNAAAAQLLINIKKLNGIKRRLES